MNKEFKLGLVACLVLILLVAGFIWWPHYNYQRNLIKSVDRHLSQEDQKTYEDRLAQANADLQKNDLSNEQRYNLLMNKGFQLYALGRLSEAVDAFADAARINSQDFTSYVAMYTAQLDMQDNRGAEKSILRAIELKPADADIWKKYIQLQMDRFAANNDQLNSLYQQALDKTHQSTDIVTAYASWLEKSGDLSKAKEYWQKAAIADSSNKKVYDAQIKRIDDLIKQLP